jgi:hypothetical protein
MKHAASLYAAIEPDRAGLRRLPLRPRTEGQRELITGFGSPGRTARRVRTRCPAGRSGTGTQGRGDTLFRYLDNRREVSRPRSHPSRVGYRRPRVPDCADNDPTPFIFRCNRCMLRVPPLRREEDDLRSGRVFPTCFSPDLIGDPPRGEIIGRRKFSGAAFSVTPRMRPPRKEDDG